MVIELDPEGNPVQSSLFFDAADLIADGPGSTDGMAVHKSDFLFVSVPNGLALLSSKGEMLGKLALGQITNMAFDESFSFLYITAPDRLLRLKIGPAAK